MGSSGIFALCIVASVAESRTAVTPIQKVLTLLGDMLAKGKMEKEEEATKFAAFDQWCTDLKRTKTDEIKAGEATMEELSAKILKAESEIRALTDRILELEEDVGRWDQDQKAASVVRKREKTDYEATLTDYTESVDALTEAIAVLKKQ